MPHGRSTVTTISLSLSTNLSRQLYATLVFPPLKNSVKILPLRTSKLWEICCSSHCTWKTGQGVGMPQQRLLRVAVRMGPTSQQLQVADSGRSGAWPIAWPLCAPLSCGPTPAASCPSVKGACYELACCSQWYSPASSLQKALGSSTERLYRRSYSSRPLRALCWCCSATWAACCSTSTYKTVISGLNYKVRCCAGAAMLPGWHAAELHL